MCCRVGSEFFFFKQKTAYELRISDWSSDVCSSDLFRDTPKAFSGDLRAQALVAQGVAAGLDRQLEPIQRVFIYLVLEHCENLAVQNEAVSRFIDLVREQPEAQRAVFEDNLDYAERPQDRKSTSLNSRH